MPSCAPHRTPTSGSASHDRLARHAFATWSLRASELPTAHSNAKETWRDARRRLAAELDDPKG
jgi:hypothetical protein